MRILVCGGRDFGDRAFVFAVLDRVHSRRGISVLIHGAATGADTLANEWAAARGVPCERYPVMPEQWRVQGRAAGPARNRRMLIEGRPDAVVAFPGGAGTRSMIGIATAVGLPVWQPRMDKDTP